MNNETKRLFFGLEVLSPWPHEFPQGRILAENCRHLTLAFLGQTPYAKLLEALPSIPSPPFKVGFAGHFDQCLFLPKRHPHVVAWHAKWISSSHLLEEYQKELTNWIKAHSLKVDEKDHFLPHVTICRAPQHKNEWQKSFCLLPLITKDLHLYESLGNSHYQSMWNLPITPPFEEIEHTADIAFRIYGEDLHAIRNHAFISLAFKFPPLLGYILQHMHQMPRVQNLDEIIIELNTVIAQADAAIGCPFKAVSFHGEILEQDNQLLMWEMIVDV